MVPGRTRAPAGVGRVSAAPGRLGAFVAALALVALVQVSPATQELAPGTQYDPSIPTLEQVVGHDVRDKITPPDQVVRYFEALAEAAPDRTHLIEYAESWEGRTLQILVIGTPDRISRLDDIKSDLHRLAHPEGLGGAEEEALLARWEPVPPVCVRQVVGGSLGGLFSAISGAAALGAASARIDDQVQFVSKLVDSMTMGVSTMTDTDMEEASARLSALQTQQELAVQSLGIANQAPQALLQLFN